MKALNKTEKDTVCLKMLTVLPFSFHDPLTDWLNVTQVFYVVSSYVGSSGLSSCFS
jgi:hypothetical protein